MITLKQALSMAPAERKTMRSRAEAALKQNPRNLDALLSKASLLHAARNNAATVETLKKAVSLRPKDLMILQWISVAAAEIRNFEVALEHSLAATKLKPEAPQIWQMRGRILEAAGDSAAALDAFEREKSLRGEYPELMLQIANSHFYLGNMDEAKKHYERTVELDPSHAMALYGLSTVSKFRSGDVADYLEKVEKAVPANAGKPDYNISALYYGAAKALEDTGSNDEAFEYYLKANEHRKPDDDSGIRVHFENNKKAFNEIFVKKHKGWGDESRQPVFVLGMPRSGTTLVESIAAAHSAMTPGGELSFMDAIAMKLGSMGPTATFVNNLFKLDKSSFRQLADSYIAGVNAAFGVETRFTDKMPHNFMNIGLILTLFPNAKIIHCRRHPADNCVSIYTNAMTPAHNYYKSDMVTLGNYYREYLSLMQYWRELFPGKMHEVCYEDVVANTELNSRRIIEYLGLDWEEGVMKRESSQKSVKTLSAWQVRQPVYSSSTGKWRKFEKHLGPLLGALGPAIEEYEAELANLQDMKA